MRWENLFDDLEGQLADELAAEDFDVRAEEERLRRARLSLRERLGALIADRPDEPLTLRVGGERYSLRAESLGRDWLAGEALSDGHASQRVVVMLAAVSSLSVTPRRARSSADGVDGARRESRLGVTTVLRDLARRRQPVTVRVADEAVHGTIDRVGADHFDLAVHDAGVPRRDRAVRETRLVALGQLSLVRL